MTTRHPLRCVPFNPNDKLPCFRGAGSFWRATLCWQTKQMQGGDCCVRNHSAELFFFFFFYWVKKIMEVEDVVTKRHEKSVWRLGRLLRESCCEQHFIPCLHVKFHDIDIWITSEEYVDSEMWCVQHYSVFNMVHFLINRGRRGGRNSSASTS